MNPFVFIVGCPRSGTTLLRRMIDAHSEVAIIDETRWIAAFFERRNGLTSEGMVTPKLIDELLEYDRFAKLEIGRKELENLLRDGPPISYPDFVAGIFDLYGRRRSKYLVGDKTPRYARRIPELHALWPHAKFVHIIRDGRDVALSVLNWKKADRALGRFSTWGRDSLTTVALWWELHLLLARETGSSLSPELYYEMQYEALISDTTNECKKLCKFLKIPYQDAMLRFHEGRERTDPGLDAKKAWRPVTAGLRDWKTQMSDADMERFEAVAGSLLEELGYYLASRPGTASLEHAAEIRHSFIKDLASRSHALPENWSS
ncbi:MAG TPA: sulfotransferase [Rubrobacteraceae bacterium]|nr:sulfotransferase [Rubrobacteraceae bacterium]